ncbi:hypothetical protein BDZ88DRAFT_490535 [Geranomyces variabilis]|nr:hypothetical protein BDZ88DRAFT_490535 [Geranomyces variabilis]
MFECTKPGTVVAQKYFSNVTAPSGSYLGVTANYLYGMWADVLKAAGVPFETAHATANLPAAIAAKWDCSNVLRAPRWNVVRLLTGLCNQRAERSVCTLPPSAAGSKSGRTTPAAITGSTGEAPSTAVNAGNTGATAPSSNAPATKGGNTVGIAPSSDNPADPQTASSGTPILSRAPPKVSDAAKVAGSIMGGLVVVMGVFMGRFARGGNSFSHLAFWAFDIGFNDIN